MRNPTRTLYWRIAGLYLVLLLGFSAVALFLGARQFEGFLGEVEQRLNRDLASHLVREMALTIASPSGPAASRTIKRIIGINPSIDMYLLDSNGAVTASFTGKDPVLTQIDVAPIRKFLTGDAHLPIRDADPSAPKSDKVFSAALVPDSLGGGYLYIILPGMPFETAAHMIRTSYILRGGVSMLVAVLLSTLLAGWALFFIVTKRFQRLSDSVKRFKEGGVHERIDWEPTDQIGRLGVTFNEMAASIEKQFAALKQSDEARGEFAANISHDFRTPLTALRGYAARLLRSDDRLTSDDRRTHLTVILQSATQLEHLADQLATIVQLDDTGRYAFKAEALSIAELAQDAVMKLAPLAEAHCIELSLIEPQDVPEVMGDVALLERAIANLIHNAIENTPSGGKIEISLPTDDAHVTFRIKDTGCGVAADEIGRLTQRFYRTKRSRAAHISGSGLGLAIVEDILKKHGATLRIESQVAIGTAFSFALPIFS